MKQKAFTYVELTVVIAIMLIAFGFFALYTQASQVRSDLNAQVNTFVSYLRLTQSNAAAGKDNSNHGIHLEENSYTIFVGDAYVEGASTNFAVDLPDTIAIQNITLNGAGVDVIFLTPQGATNTYGSLDFTSQQINKTISITIGQLGNIEY